MQFQRIVIASIVAVLFGAAWSSTADAQPLRYGSPCYNGPMVGCAPRRTTWGYYETHWRRWPTDPGIGTPTPAAEPIATPTPTPADKPPTDEGPSGPTIVPEEGQPAPSMTPGAGEPAPGPGAQPDATLPFADEPPMPPGEPAAGAPSGTLAPSEPAPAIPDLEPKVQAPPSEAPPTMPDDDPFKDDAAQPPAVPSAPAANPGLPQGTDAGGVDPEASQAGLRWRAAPKGAPPLVESAEKPPHALKAAVARSQPQATKLSALQPADPPPQLNKIAPAASRSANASAPSAPSSSVGAIADVAVVSEPAPVAISERNPLRGTSRPKAVEIAEAAAKVGVAAPMAPEITSDVESDATDDSLVAQLPTEEVPEVAPMRMLPMVTPAGRNPLRLATADAPASAVVPAAWIEPEGAKSAAREALRSNPLRTN